MKVAQSSLTFCRVHGLDGSWNSPGQNTEVGSLSLLQGIFPTQGRNPGLPHCRQILHQLSHKGSPQILEWATYPSPGDLPDPGIEPGSPALQTDSYQLSYQGSPAVGNAAANASRSPIQPICKLPTINPIIILYGVARFTFWSQNFFQFRGYYSISLLLKSYILLLISICNFFGYIKNVFYKEQQSYGIGLKSGR